MFVITEDMRNKETILNKLKIDKVWHQAIKATHVGTELFLQAATRLVSSFSLSQKNYKTFEQGYNESLVRLIDAVKLNGTTNIQETFEKVGHGYRGEETGILLDNQQEQISHSRCSSSLIYGGFGTGKTEMALIIIRQFCEKVIRNFSSRGVLIVSMFSNRGYCTNMIEDYETMIRSYLRIHGLGWQFQGASYGVSSMVCAKNWLLDRFGIDFKKSHHISPVLVINKLMGRIKMVHPDTEICLVLDEVSSEDVVNWGYLVIPERLTLVLVLKPIRSAKDTSNSFTFSFPPENIMRVIKLSRQYRSATNINMLVSKMNIIASTFGIFHSMILPELVCSEAGHEIQGDVSYWYHLKSDARGNFQKF